jgi:very-short-patch-repair endonuclease
MGNWIKFCPVCGVEQTYSTEKILKAAVRDNKPCKSCNPGSVGAGEKNGMFGKSHSDEAKKSIAENTRRAQTGRPKSEEWKRKARERMLGYKHPKHVIDKLRKPKTEEHKAKLRGPKTEEHKEKLRGPRPKIKGAGNPMFGKIRHDFRLRVLEAYESTGKKPTAFYNPVACDAIDRLSEEMGCKFQHALNGGEHHIKQLGYWVDGYDPINNIVVEYDEPHHQTERQQKKDLVRQEEIIKHLNCKFIRLIENKDGSTTKTIIN